MDFNGYYNPYQRYLQPQIQPQMQQTYQAPPLQGRVVHSVNEITANDVNMSGGASFFPLADESAIVVRRWNPNGTISSAVYTRMESNEEQKENETDIVALIEPISKELAEIKAMLTTKGRKAKKHDEPDSIRTTDDD